MNVIEEDHELGCQIRDVRIGMGIRLGSGPATTVFYVMNSIPAVVFPSGRAKRVARGGLRALDGMDASKKPKERFFLLIRCHKLFSEFGFGIRSFCVIIGKICVALSSACHYQETTHWVGAMTICFAIAFAAGVWWSVARLEILHR